MTNKPEEFFLGDAYSTQNLRSIDNATIMNSLNVMKEFAKSSTNGLDVFVKYINLLYTSDDEEKKVTLCNHGSFHKTCLHFLNKDSVDVHFIGGDMDHFKIVQSSLCYYMCLSPITHPILDSKYHTEYAMVATRRLQQLDFANPSHLLYGRNLLFILQFIVEMRTLSLTTLRLIAADLFLALQSIERKDEQEESVMFEILSTLDGVFSSQFIIYPFELINQERRACILLNLIKHNNKMIAIRAMQVLEHCIKHNYDVEEEDDDDDDDDEDEDEDEDEEEDENDSAFLYFKKNKIIEIVQDLCWNMDRDYFYAAINLVYALSHDSEAWNKLVIKSTIPSAVRVFLSNADNYRYWNAVVGCFRIIHEQSQKTNIMRAFKIVNKYVGMENMLFALKEIGNDLHSMVRTIQNHMFSIKACAPSADYFNEAQAIVLHAAFPFIVKNDPVFANCLLADVQAFKVYREAREPNVVYVEKIIDEECHVCTVHGKNTIFLPCKHLLCCESCAADVKDCPVCRTPIESKITAKLC